MENKKQLRIGESKINQWNSKMTIVEYIDNKNITVEFEGGVKVSSAYAEFRKGNIRNPYDKTLLGVGYLGQGKYKTTIKKKHSFHYALWKRMMQRCYDSNIHKTNPTYIDCTVTEEWHNFQNFAKWIDDNYYEFEEEKMHLDKDILVKGNKVYSPDTCIFVPARINTLFIKSDGNRNSYIGVSYRKDRERYNVRLRRDGRKIFLGDYNNPEDAFEVYKEYKEAYIKQMAERYKESIPNTLYNAMIKYKVDITD